MKSQATTLTWITDLARSVLEEVLPIDPLAPIGCHHFFNEETAQHEVTLFASKTEIVGGAEDGRKDDSRFCLDLNGVAGLFDSVGDFRWQTSAAHEEDDLGGHVSVEGIYRGVSVWLRILGSAPSQFEHGRTLNVHTLQVENRWG